MFGKKTSSESKAGKTASAAAETVAPELNMARAALSTDEKKPVLAEGGSRRNTVIAKHSQFTGNIKVEGDVQVYGEVIGNIHVTEGTIRVMHAGRIEGELNAPEIIIDGTVEGTCNALSIDILEHGELRGISRSVNLAIKRGGVFVGQSEQIEKPQAKAEKEAASRVVSIKSTTGGNEEFKKNPTLKPKKMASDVIS